MFVYRIFTYTWIWLNGCQLYFQTGHLHFFASLMWTGNKGSNSSNNNSRSTLDLVVVIGQAWGTVKQIVSKWGNIQRHFDGPLVNWVSWSLFRCLSCRMFGFQEKSRTVMSFHIEFNYVHVVMRIYCWFLIYTCFEKLRSPNIAPAASGAVETVNSISRFR